MEKILKNFSDKYSLDADIKIFKEDAKRSSNNPILFLFIGDKVKEASDYIRNSIKEKWDNGKAIVFMNVLRENIEDEDNEFNFYFKCGLEDNRSLRKSIRDKFYNDKEILHSLNSKITMVRDKIISSGSLFNSFENISISVVTRSDDPINIILPEITMLVKKRMMEVFKLGVADLYVLIKENNMEDEFFSQVLSMSFFREIEYVQNKNFYFEEKIDVYGKERELKVQSKGPIFYFTYMLEEKNEKGLIDENSMKNNYDIIGYINLLKNRNVSIDTFSDTENQHYDNTRFKANITSDDLINRYVTAGLSSVKRPNNAIAATVVRAFYENIVCSLKKASDKNYETIIEKLNLNEEIINSKAEAFLNNNVTVRDMNSIMMCNTSDVEKRLSKLNLRQVEEILYGDRCYEFFSINFIEHSKNRLKDIDLYEEMDCLIREQILNNNKFGLYCGFKWTSDNGEAVAYICDRVKSIKYDIERLEDEIERIYNSKIEEGFSFKSIFNRGKRIENIKEKIFSEIYGRKLEILKLNISREILEKYKTALIKINKNIESKIEELSCIHSIIKECEDKIIKSHHGYTGQNIKAYYTNVVNSIVNNIKEKQGEYFYFQENYFGNLIENLNKGKEEFIKRLTQVCNKYILKDIHFMKSFEEELNERANVQIDELNTKVISKEDLYRKLYNILDEKSALKAYIMNYDVKSYQEKYFFGDYSSDFIKYAFDFDRKTRNYKIGYVHERRISGIEKLNLLGGFGAKDIFYVRNSVDKYNDSLEKGYELHGIDLNKLPKII